MPHRKSHRRIAKAARVAQLRSLAADSAPRTTALPWESIADLEDQIVGRVVLPGEAGYDAARQESNPAFQAYPKAIVYCVCEGDVLACMALARELSLTVALRSGGHSTAGYSVNDGLVVDLSGLCGVVLDEANALVHVLPGTNFDHFNGALDGTGWHVPSGACGSVCVAGFVQGGGYGYTSRAFGIQSDCVAAFRVALADGCVVVADAAQNTDLFWALRGGTGGNFGVVLQVSYRMARLESVWAYAIAWDAGVAAQVLALLQSHFMRSGAPDALGYMMNLGFHGGRPVYLMQGMYCGSADAGKAALAPLLEITSAQLLVDTVGSYPQMDKLLEDRPYPLPEALPDGICETKRSGYIAATLAPADWQRLVDYFATSPNTWSLAYLEPYGGAIGRVPVADSAFVHRAVDADLVVDVFWRDDAEREQMEAWLAGLMNVVAPFLNGEVYQNYPNGDLQDFAAAYWGPAYPRLQRIKQARDPANFFRFQQSVEPRSGSGPAEARRFSA